MKRDFEAIVLGLGGIGSGAAYWLSRRFGPEVLGLERFHMGHDRGASHDHSRIIRLSYHSPAYVRFAKLAYDAWDLLALDAGEQVVLETGGLDLGPRDGAISLEPYAASMAACGVPFERLDAAEIRRRYPPFAIDDDVHGLFQARGGIAMAAKATAAHQRLARSHGATLFENVELVRAEERAGEVRVETADGAYRAGRLIVAAGAWTNAVLSHFDLRLPLTVTKEQVTYFHSPALEPFMPAVFPVWIWFDEPSFYGFPVFGGPGIKVAQDVGGRPVEAETRTFETDPDNLARVRAFMERVLPAGLGSVAYTKTCLYTLTPDRDFVIDTLPARPNVAVAIGAGHAFKFASAIGKTLAELVTERRTEADIASFPIDRHVLTLADPPVRYLV